MQLAENPVELKCFRYVFSSKLNFRKRNIKAYSIFCFLVLFGIFLMVNCFPVLHVGG